MMVAFCLLERCTPCLPVSAEEEVGRGGVYVEGKGAIEFYNSIVGVVFKCPAALLLITASIVLCG